MNLCADDHDQIAHTSDDCPLCEMRTELEERVNEMTDKYDDAVSDGESIQAELDNAVDQLEEYAALKEKLGNAISERL